MDFLTAGQLITGLTTAWLGNFGELGKPYVHPTTKQCNYTVDTSSFATITQLNELKTSVSNGKSLIASAITDKGISTAFDATFQLMADNIASIATGAEYQIFNGNTYSQVYDKKFNLSLTRVTAIVGSYGTYQYGVRTIYAADGTNTTESYLGYDSSAHTVTFTQALYGSWSFVVINDPAKTALP